MSSITNAYETTSLEDSTVFLFESVGIKGTVVKVVLFQHVLGNLYNLAFGDFLDGGLNDKTVTNNNDVSSVLSTVAKCVSDFLEKHPGSRLRIRPVDERRRALYNFVIRSKIEEIKTNFEVFGVENGFKKPFDPKILFTEFELRHRVP
ncbi:MAG: hypothetical protein MUC59_09265 [Saprospiraceae bacterium]|nr:hypothetical protein [Saprospiraceae bacterium]